MPATFLIVIPTIYLAKWGGPYMSFREGITEAHTLSRQWRDLFTNYPTRFLVGTDTYIPQRWLQLPEITVQYRDWLAQLPTDVAKAIAHGNGARLFGK